jgi:hypothetical protein
MRAGQLHGGDELNKDLEGGEGASTAGMQEERPLQ